MGSRVPARWLPAVIVVSLSAILAGCNDRPTESDAEAAFRDKVASEWGERAQVRSFKKTDGLGYEKNGVKAYELAYTASVDRPAKGATEVTGTVTFVRTEHGWNAADVSGETDEQRQAAQQRERDIAERANVVRARQDIRVLESALALYKLDNFHHPSTEQGLAALVNPPDSEPKPVNYKSGGYIQDLPNDPWGNPYQYANPGTRSEFDLFSFGADGKPDGEGAAEDIGNWNLP